jgi:ABC-type cobalamin/Fe3+-siderophores transport system ATPase subunit
MSSKNTRGSEWRKWDLHVHTPASLIQQYKGQSDEQKWEEFISDLEKLPSEFSVIGINDYLFIDGYEKILEYKQQGRISNISTILPVIEFRIKKFAGNDRFKRINFHVIFSDELNLKDIKAEFLNQLQIVYDGLDFNKVLNRDNLIEFGQKIIESVPSEKRIDFDSPLTEGFNNCNFEEDKIRKLLNTKFKGKYLTAIGKTEWDAIKWDDNTIGEKKDLMGKADIVFTASESIGAFHKAKKSLTDAGVNDNLLDCSDAHHNFDSSNKDRIGNCFTWIKADPTFEGLKQILHEPNHRVYIGEKPPLDPPIYIPGITLNFPDTATTGDKDDPFCLRGKKHELPFSPNFTCIIGGRGTGKSTVLNLLAKTLDSNQKLKYPIKVNGKTVLDEYVQIESKALGIDPEYVSQNEIEKFARNTDELTISLIDRLAERDSGKNLEKYKNEVGNNDKVFSYLLESNTQLRELKNNLDFAKKKLATTQNIKSTYRSEEYSQLVETGRNVADSLRRIRHSQDRFFKLRASLTEISQDFRVTDEEVPNKYDTSFKEIINDLNALLKRYSSLDFSEEENKVRELSSIKIENQNNIHSYLEECGVSPENQNRLSGIEDEIAELGQQIQDYEEEISRLEEERGRYSNFESVAKITKERYEQTLQSLIKEANDRLGQKGSKYVKSICLEYKFSFEQANKNLYEQFCQEFKSEIISSSVKQNSYLSEIFKECVDIEKVLNNVEETSFRQKLAGHPSTAQAKQFLIELFSSDENYKRLGILCKRNYYNPVEFLVIEATYDGRPLKDTSFGQRCTAVLILLLLLGSNPIIIDEPEAHLDSLLISNYLVDLIKEQKKHRQIIFATHNANFVINGDAELIYVLDEGENGTTITPATIENKEHKEKLIALEGGKEAFSRREQRYKLK